MSPRILVVDDESKWRDQIRYILEIMKYEVDAVQGFNEANELLKRNGYDLIVLDICLDQADPSYMSFQKFCVFLREKNPKLPIVAVSGERIDPRFMFNLRDQGVSDFVSKKDFLVDDFKNRVTKLIHPAGSSPNTDRISILFLAADPTDASRLRLGEEFRVIQESLRRAAQRDRFRLEL